MSCAASWFEQKDDAVNRNSMVSLLFESKSVAWSTWIFIVWHMLQVTC